MRHIIEKGLKPTTGANCLFTNLCDVARFYSCKLEEYEVFFLSDGMRCGYVNGKDRHVREIHKNIIVNDYYTAIKNFTEEINVSPELAYCSKDMGFIAGLVDAVGRNHPVILIMNSKCLEYQTPPPHLKDVDAMHVVIAYGFDTEKEKIYFYDSYVYDGLYHHVPYYEAELPFKTVVENACSSVWFDFGGCGNVDKKAIFKKVGAALKDFVYPESGDGTIGGIAAFERCIRDMELLKGMDGEETKKEFNELFYLFKIRLSFANSYLLKFVSDTASIPESEKSVITRELEELIKDWNSYLMKMLIGSCLGNDRVIDRIIDGGLRLAVKQKGAILDIIRIMDCRVGLL